jgi:hypothetical protein
LASANGLQTRREEGFSPNPCWTKVPPIERLSSLKAIFLIIPA